MRYVQDASREDEAWKCVRLERVASSFLSSDKQPIAWAVHIPQETWYEAGRSMQNVSRTGCLWALYLWRFSLFNKNNTDKCNNKTPACLTVGEESSWHDRKPHDSCINTKKNTYQALFNSLTREHTSAAGVSPWAQRLTHTHHDLNCKTKTTWQHSSIANSDSHVPDFGLFTTFQFDYSRVACWSACKCADSIVCLCCHTTVTTTERSDPLKRRGGLTLPKKIQGALVYQSHTDQRWPKYLIPEQTCWLIYGLRLNDSCHLNVISIQALQDIPLSCVYTWSSIQSRMK